MHDLAFALRLLRKSPSFTLLAVLCLAIGIGVNSSIFSLLDFVYLRPLPVGHADRVVVLSRGGSPLFPYPEYRALRDGNQSLAGLAISCACADDTPADACAFPFTFTCQPAAGTSHFLVPIL